MRQLPSTLLEAIRHFSFPETCHAYMAAIKWPDGRITCPKCGSENVGTLKRRRMFQCRVKGCRKQFSVKLGTIFEESPIGLDKWLTAIWCITNFKVGISSCELARSIGVTQKTAWFMLHRVRVSMETRNARLLSGVVESDETYVGGKAKNMHKSVRERKITGRGMAGKTIVHGMIDRGGDVRLSVVPNAKTHTLQSKIEENVQKGSIVYTDRLASYDKLDADYIHAMVDHAVQYVNGEVHTNTMENFWSLLKRMLGGTYVAVAPKHLIRYCSEEAFRFNEREETDSERFATVMNRVPGRRLTYADLTAT